MRNIINLKDLLKILRKWEPLKNKKINAIEYWEKRVESNPLKSVFNIGHKEEDLEAVTLKQKKIIFPILKKHLNGAEKLALDFGCGYGRFTHDLALLINGIAIGMDPIDKLLELAPKYPNVTYTKFSSNEIALSKDSVDLLFICLVLGGITEFELKKLVIEFKRVLNTNAIICLVENTSKKRDGDFWYFRDANWYISLFDFTTVEKVETYYDLDEEISIMIGRRK